MANHRPAPTQSSIAASVWFMEYLQKKVIDEREAVKLADAIEMERKSIYAYAYGKSSPKLETVAKILAYYGETEIKIPLKIAEVEK